LDEQGMKTGLDRTGHGNSNSLWFGGFSLWFALFAKRKAGL